MARDDDKSVVEEVRQRIGPKPDETNNPPPKKLPKSIQETLDNEEKLWEALYEGHGRESTETNWRYAAYATRIRTLLLSAHRYVAYTSDIGESFRPVAHPYLVKGAYGISWAYLAGDVAHEGYKAYLRNQRVLHPDATSPADAISGHGSGHDSKEREKLGNVGAVVGSDKFAAQQPQSMKLGTGVTGGARDS
ncbi:hypothetical protein H2199_008220 [Coniosporium tulheliwenetii]|uniref:Uncharacterized protein n=1 Tax=Coniosporium tulheliwenetii TaxID=3383036 RepID=A0ACC2YKR4_9PEZI|nr:hypothetical protein H2199_008220 [Cladosporium sp. JES 115]